MSEPEKCGESCCLDDIEEYGRRDSYTKCTLPKGHDGAHRVTFSDDYKRIELSFCNIGYVDE